MPIVYYAELNSKWFEKEGKIGIDGNPVHYLSMKDHLEPQAYPYEQEIAQYLEECGESYVTSPKIHKDVFTGESTGIWENSAIDDEYMWPTCLPYYVRKYHLRLDNDFENYILKKMSLK